MTGAVIPMISPDGKIGDVPNERVKEAQAAGFQIGVDMISPQGTKGVIPHDRVEEAKAAGFVTGQPAAAPNPLAKAVADQQRAQFAGLPGGSPDVPTSNAALVPGGIALTAAGAVAAGPTVAAGGRAVAESASKAFSAWKALPTRWKVLIGAELLKALGLGSHSSKLTKIVETVGK